MVTPHQSLDLLEILLLRYWIILSKDIDTNNIVAIGCDGTVVNADVRGGIIRLLEDKFERPLHWFVSSACK